MARLYLNRKQGPVFLLLLVLLIATSYFANQKQPVPSASITTETIISPSARAHILYGDERGGGHLYGTGKACKTEFPQNWDETKIIEAVSLIAANDNADWRVENNGYHVTEQKHENLTIRVVKGRQNKKIITAYPTKGGVRNPCPANDN